MSEEKKEYKVLNPIGWNGRRERGEIISLTEAEAAAIGGNVELFVPEVPVVEKPLADKPIEDMKKAELESLAAEMKLDTTGSKADLVESITLAKAEKAK